MKKQFLFVMLIVFIGTVLQTSSCRKLDQLNGCDCEVEKTASSTLSVWDTKPEAEYSTFDYSGKLEADGACHANMMLTFYWSDPEQAMGTTRPPLIYEFQSLFGYFPTNQGMERTWYDENDRVHYWQIEISEAIDKSKPEGSSYGIHVQYNGIGGELNTAIMCQVVIKYKVYNADAYEHGCER